MPRCSVGLAQRFGIVTLIARGYRGLSYAMLLIYVIPLMTYGLWRLLRHKDRKGHAGSLPLANEAR